LSITEMDFNLNLTIKTFKVPNSTQSISFGYILKYNKKLNYLFLFYPTYYISIFDITKGKILSHFELEMGRQVFDITSVSFSEQDQMFFTSNRLLKNIVCFVKIEKMISNKGF